MFTNPNPNLHIDLLKSQYAVFSTVFKRLNDNKPKSQDTYQLGYELYVLKLYIIIKEDEQRTNVIS
jgi:hypothetical protein